MATLEIPIRIPDDPYTQQEQFIELAPDIEIGNQGTIRFQNYSFKDGQAVYLNVNGLKVCRDAGFQKPLTLLKANAEKRVYCFLGCQWFRQTTTPDTSLTSLQQKVGQFGFWIGLYEWLMEVGDSVAGIVDFLLAPLIVVPALLVQFVRFLFGLFVLVLICVAIWQLIFSSLEKLLFG